MDLSTLFSFPLISAGRGGFVGDLVGWFIRVVIYDICISTIQSVLGVSRMVALFIFLGILAVVAITGYVIRQKASPNVDD